MYALRELGASMNWTSSGRNCQPSAIASSSWGTGQWHRCTCISRRPARRSRRGWARAG